jgi:hypothetical protein
MSVKNLVECVVGCENGSLWDIVCSLSTVTEVGNWVVSPCVF